MGSPDFVWLTEVLVPSWPAADCPLCRDGVPVNTQYAHGADFLAQQGRRERRRGPAGGRRPDDPGPGGPDRGGPHLQGGHGGPGRPRCARAARVDRGAAGRGARADPAPRRTGGRARVGARSRLRPVRARGRRRGRRARGPGRAARRGGAPVRAAPGPRPAPVADRLPGAGGRRHGAGLASAPRAGRRYGQHAPGPRDAVGRRAGGRSAAPTIRRPRPATAPTRQRRQAHLAAFLRREFARSAGRSPFDGRSAEAADRLRSVSLPELHDAGRALAGATLNDSVLAVVAGALRAWVAAPPR